MTEAGAASAPMTIPAAFAATVAAHGDTVAVVADGVTLTYSELGDLVRDVGAALVHAGIGAGDRVAIWAPNSLRWIAAVLGLSAAGATLVPVNTRFKGDEAAVVLSRSGARMLITTTDFLGADHVAMLRSASIDLPDLDTIVVVDGPAAGGTVAWEDLLGAVTDDDRAGLDLRAAAVTPEDPSDILFTSGTTGVPKGVVQTHRGTMGVARDWVAMTGIRHGDRYLMVNPYFHMFGLKAGILPSITTGLTMYPVPVFDADTVLDLVEQEAITVLPGAPTLYQSILDGAPGAGATADGGRDLSSLRIAVTGAADIPVPLIRRIMDELPFEVVLVGYGLSEAGTATATGPGDPPEAVATTVGRPRPGVQLRIVDGDGAEVTDGEAGEILVKGPTVMSHYLDDPGGHRRDPVGRRLAAHRRHRSGRRRRAAPHRGTGQGHVHRRRLQRLPRRDRERAACATRDRPGRGDRHPRRTPRRGRHGLRRASRRVRPRRPTRSSPGPATRWPTTRRLVGSKSSRSCPSTPPGRSRRSCALPGAGPGSTLDQRDRIDTPAVPGAP